MGEIWKDIPGFEGLYQVSDLGRVKSLPRTVPRTLKSGVVSTTRISERILKPGINKHGYPFVVLRADGCSITREIHTLVARAFLGERPFRGAQIRHMDGDSLNSALSNLSYGTASENQLDTYRYRGRHHRLTAENVREIRRRIEAGELFRLIAADFGVSESNISEIKHRRSFAWLD